MLSCNTHKTPKRKITKKRELSLPEGEFGKHQRKREREIGKASKHKKDFMRFGIFVPYKYIFQACNFECCLLMN